jgi:hypothetical protein
MNKIFAFLLFASCSTYGMEESSLSRVAQMHMNKMRQELQRRTNNKLTDSDMRLAIDQCHRTTNSLSTFLTTLSNLTGISRSICTEVWHETTTYIINNYRQN